jgi:hypothetical protein
MNTFSDFADGASVMDGRKLSLDSVLGRLIIIHRYRIADSKFEDASNPRCLMVQFEFAGENGERFVFFSGSSVLMNQLETYKDKIPFSTIIKKMGRYFTFS